MMREHKFEMMEHTADVGVVGRGSTLAEAFENVAYGMFSVMADLGKYTPTGSTEVEAEGEDGIDLLQRFLSGLIVLFDGEAVLPLGFEVTEVVDSVSLKCRVHYRPFGQDIEWLGPSVKAVTYHQMAVEKTDGEWMARAILDI